MALPYPRAYEPSNLRAVKQRVAKQHGMIPPHKLARLRHDWTGPSGRRRQACGSLAGVQGAHWCAGCQRRWSTPGDATP